MASITIADHKTRLASKIHGTNLDKVNDVYGLIYEASGNVLLRIDPQETIRTTQIENAIYDDVFEYATPSDIKGDSVIDIRPQVNRTTADKAFNTYGVEFDTYKKQNQKMFSVRSNSGVKTLEIAWPTLAGSLLNGCDSLTSNGTWSATASASNLAVDEINKISSSGSLSFDLAAAGSSGYIENSTMTQVDLTDYVNVGALFVWCYIPNTTAITSVNLRWGSDSSNYYNRTVTTGLASTSFVTGWNLLRFDWSGSTQTGTPVNTLVDYVRVTFNYNGTAVPSCRVDSVMAKIGSIFEIDYYSNCLFRNSSGTWIEKPTADTDIINLETESYNVFLYENCLILAQEIGSTDASFDVSFWKARADQAWTNYFSKNKSQTRVRQSTYYRMPGMSRR